MKFEVKVRNVTLKQVLSNTGFSLELLLTVFPFALAYYLIITKFLRGYIGMPRQCITFQGLIVDRQKLGFLITFYPNSSLRPQLNI